ncbi:cytoplasmic protein [Plantibacter flavus]|uniref:cupin domain-containing protein n=1 Tax=Plantibacter flavus TaxID=150123 RepID=UPI003F1929FA
MITDDPTLTNPDHYRTLWENEHVRVLEYTDEPGDRTTPHDHPNSVLVALSDFSRRLMAGGRTFDTALVTGQTVWIPAQRHSGENTGATPTHTILIELKGDAAGEASAGALGPQPTAPEDSSPAV